MISRIILVCLLAVSSSAFALRSPTPSIPKTVVQLSGGAAPAVPDAPPPPLKVRKL
jgi:hypothetical protein